jgi:cytosine/adenosine deaminase-related metal-dependent hydrolase
MPATSTVQARWIFPVDRPPIHGGMLTMAGDRILAVEGAGRNKPDTDLGNVALLPGLVNTHTHLDLSGLRGRLPPTSDFTQWLRQVVAYRRNSPPSQWQDAVRAGVDECLRSGTTLVGDVAADGLSAALLAASPLRSVVFYEIIGLSTNRAQQTWQDADRWLQSCSPSPNCRYGLSPHAPYSVRRSLWHDAVRHGVPLAVHWRETREEEELLKTNRGPLRSFLEEIGAWDESGLAESHERIREQLTNASSVLYVHCNYIDEIEFAIRDPQSAIAYCPRTHAFFGHAEHPFVELLAAGVNVALGTDSLASNPDLSILEEMRFLWNRYRGRVTGETLMRMGTVNGAAALGWERELGTLTPGKSADWITVPLDNAAGNDPYELLLSPRTPVKDVCLRGVYVSRG